MSESEKMYTPPPVDGYRELSQVEIDQMNQIKRAGRELEKIVGLLRQNPEFDQRWVSIGATNIQTGLMALVRAVARPTNF